MAGKTKAQKEAEALLAKAIEVSGLSAEEFAALSDDEKAVHTAKAKEALEPTPGEVDDSHLIKVSKDGVELEVHPSALSAHKSLGWKEV